MSTEKDERKHRDAMAALAEIRQLIADGKLTGEYLIGAIKNIAEKGPVNAAPQTARKPCRHEAIIGLDSKWHCQRCGDAIEITAAFPRSQADSASIREAHEAFDRKLRNNVIEECAEVAEKYWAREVASQIRALTRPACTPTDNKEVGQL